MTTTTTFATLTGTDKQIAWAEDIRRKEMAALAQRITECKASFAPAAAQYPVQAAKMMTNMDDFAAAQSAKTEATYWINDLRAQGDPRQQLNRLMEQWAVQMQAEIAGN